MYFSLDGKILPAGQPAFLPDNKSYRYGDGLFETIKMVKGEMPLWDEHRSRLQSGLQLLDFSPPGLFTMEKLRSDIIALCNKNQHQALGRIRLSVSRGEGGIYEQEHDRFHYLVESWQANPATNRLNENGLVIGIFPYARKAMDIYACLKSANYLPYTMAARFARQQQWNDCLVLNSEGNIADATIANVFLVKDEVIITPTAGQGGVNGVMRKFLLEKLRTAGYAIKEMVVTIEMVMEADELFLTNAMNGIRWAGKLENKSFTNRISLSIFREFVQPLWS
jgi:branched-subunit amino acid aminotransferase/4-amino-4-deoxychorismate lyase